MKDKALYLLGKIEKSRINAKNEADYFIEHPFTEGEFWALIFSFKIIADEDNVLKVEFDNYDFEKFNDENYLKLAYKKGTSLGGDITVSTKLTKGKNEKENLDNMRKKLNAVVNSLKNFQKFYSSKQYNENKYFDLILDELQQNNEKYKTLLNEILLNTEKDKTQKLVFSIKINGQYLYEFQSIREYIIFQGHQSKYYMSSIGTSKAQDKVCSVTLKKEDEVYGLAFPLPYASVDKPGMVANFFKQRENWKNYPVSREAAFLLDLGVKYLLRNLSSWFYVSSYAALPSPILDINFEKYKKLVKRFEQVFADERKNRQAKAKIEDLVMKKIAEEQNYFTIDLIFYKQDKNAFKILKYIEQILPSRFRTLFVDVPNIINEKPIFLQGKLVNKKKRKKADEIEYENLTFNFGIIKTFFGEAFLDVVHKAFLGEPMAREFLFDNFMDTYRNNYKNIKAQKAFETPYNLITKAFMTYFYFAELGILKYNKNFNYMETTQQTSKSFLLDQFNDFIKQHQDFFDSDEKIGLFALGVLIKYVMDFQYSNLGSTPFENKLHGYNLNPELIQSIYNEAINKLIQYGNQYTYKELREIVAEKLVLNFPKLKRLSNNELSFYVVSGIELGKKFKKQNEENQENEE